MSEPVTVYLGLGSNLGQRGENLGRALALLCEQVRVEAVSSVYETEPVGYREQPLFLNLVCRTRTSLTPEELLRLVKDIEARLGRVPSFVDAPRPIDIDILFYGDTNVKTDNLTIPHFRLQDRAFVLIPLAELAPDLVHPVLGKTIAQLLGRVQGQEGVRKHEGGLDVSAVCRRAL